uniref:Uncharacterized protein n=1 Tax=Oryza sativa subsp. japonica TaxID=39947 RepID=Q6ZIX8_ORYSJ|nr:hypothetical protein [Oryza sativa Japonica Group]
MKMTLRNNLFYSNSPIACHPRLYGLEDVLTGLPESRTNWRVFTLTGSLLGVLLSIHRSLRRLVSGCATAGCT